MSGVQMMLVLGAMILLSMVVLTINRAKLFSEQQISQSEYTIAATSVGQGLLNEISSKSFDAATVSKPDAEVSTFTAPGSLGRNSSEIYPNFNDVDDYHRFSRTYSTPRAGDFNVTASVHYINTSQPNTPVNYRTRTKRVTVVVSSPFMEQPVTLFHYFSH
ncbi:MAG TPA: hypothetical protein PK916_05380 [Bacteroidota bacterium]|nr:hypothetical protein [Bacteroidota bacterium]